MKLKTKKFLTLVPLLALSFGFFPSVIAEQDSRSADLNFTSPSPVKIFVSEIIQTATITAAAGSHPTAEQLGCAGGQYLEKTLIQDQALVNLNQPAKCFSLAPAELIQKQTRLSVYPLVRFQQRIVVLPTARIAKDFLRLPANSAPAGTQGMPINPVLMVSMGIFFSSAVLLKLKKLISTVKLDLSLSRLQILRC